MYDDGLFIFLILEFIVIVSLGIAIYAVMYII